MKHSENKIENKDKINKIENYSNNNISNDSNKYEIKIQELNEQIKLLKQQLGNEINKNNDLNNQIKNLDTSYKEILIQNKNLMEVNKRLSDELSLIKKKNVKNNIELNSEEIITLYKKVEELKEKLSRYPIELLKGEKLISVIFTSEDQKIQHSIICKNTEKLSRLVEKLYNDYPEYSEYSDQYFFISNGKKVNMFKSLDENNIHNSDIIILNIFKK